MAKGKVKVLGSWPSPFVTRARIALNLKSVEYEHLEEDLPSKSDLLLKSNPVHKQIPVLIHDDKPVCESIIIVEYVDEVWSSGPPILPSDPYDRATARFWAAYVDEKLVPTLKDSVFAEGADATKAAIAQVIEILVVMEDAHGSKCSKGKPFFGGNQIGFVDIAFGCYLGWVRVSEKVNEVKLLDEVKTPGLLKWAESFCADDAVKDVMPDTVKLADYGNKFRTKLGPSPPPPE